MITLLISDVGRFEAKPNHAGVTAMVFLGLLACCIASEMPLSGFVSAGFFLVYLIRVAVLTPHFIAKYLPLYFGAVANIGGCFVCEYADIYLSELQVASGFTGSLPLLALAHWTFFWVLGVYDRKFGVEDELADEPLQARGFVNAATTCVLLCLLAIFVFVAPNPSFLVGADRFAYANLMPAFLRKPWDWMSFLMLFPIMSIKESRSKRGLLAVALYVLCAVWTGAKFGAFFSLICLAVIACYDKLLKLGRSRLTKIILAVFAAIATLVIGAAFLNGFVSTSGQTSSQFLEQRLAQQGQLWWATYERAAGVPHYDQVSVEIEGALAPTGISDNVGSQYGIYGIMYLNAPASVVDAKLVSGSRYTESGFATWYYCLGIVGPLLLAVLMGFVLAFAYNSLVRAVFTGRPIEAALISKIAQVLRTVYSMGTLASLVMPLSVFTIALLLVLYLTRYGNPRSMSESSARGYSLLSNRGLANTRIDRLTVDRNESHLCDSPASSNFLITA